LKTIKKFFLAILIGLSCFNNLTPRPNPVAADGDEPKPVLFNDTCFDLKIAYSVLSERGFTAKKYVAFPSGSLQEVIESPEFYVIGIMRKNIPHIMILLPYYMITSPKEHTVSKLLSCLNLSPSDLRDRDIMNPMIATHPEVSKPFMCGGYFGMSLTADQIGQYDNEEPPVLQMPERRGSLSEDFKTLYCLQRNR